MVVFYCQAAEDQELIFKYFHSIHTSNNDINVRDNNSENNSSSSSSINNNDNNSSSSSNPSKVSPPQQQQQTPTSTSTSKTTCERHSHAPTSVPLTHSQRSLRVRRKVAFREPLVTTAHGNPHEFTVLEKEACFYSVRERNDRKNTKLAMVTIINNFSYTPSLSLSLSTATGSNLI